MVQVDSPESQALFYEQMVEKEVNQRLKIARSQILARGIKDGEITDRLLAQELNRSDGAKHRGGRLRVNGQEATR